MDSVEFGPAVPLAQTERQGTEGGTPPGAPASHRVLVVDDRPEIRILLRTRLNLIRDIDVIGEASNGEEALILVAALGPEAVVLDLEMPVMRGDEAIPLMRALAPDMRILLYTGADDLSGIDEEAQPDAIVRKGTPLDELVATLRSLLSMRPFDVLRLELGSIPLHQVITAFDTWVGLNVRILDALAHGDTLARDQLSGATLEELRALIGVYAHLGDNLQRASRRGAVEVDPIIHVLRTSGAAARRALIAFNHVHTAEFYAAWDYEVPPAAADALMEMRNRLVSILPMNGGAVGDAWQDRHVARADASTVPRPSAAVDSAADVATDVAMSTQDMSSIDAATGAYLSGPGQRELRREIARAHRTKEPLTLVRIDVDSESRPDGDVVNGGMHGAMWFVAKAIKDNVREDDVTVRHGSGAFACMLTGLGLPEVRARMELVGRSLVSRTPHSSIRAGVADLQLGESLESLISRAETDLDNSSQRDGTDVPTGRGSDASGDDSQSRTTRTEAGSTVARTAPPPSAPA